MNMTRAVAIVIVFEAINYGVPAVHNAVTPFDLRLKADKAHILTSERLDGANSTVVAYRYESDEDAPELPNENIAKRTEHVVTFDLGSGKHEAQSGYDFYQQDGVWKKVNTATTTIEVFDRPSNLIGYAVKKVYAATVGPNSPGTMADDATVGTVTWTSPDNAKVSDDLKAIASLNCGSASVTENSIKIIKTGSIIGNEKSTGATIPTSDTYISYGGSADLWGTSWTTTDINASDFGVVFSANETTNVSHYLKATNFGFVVPAGSTIDGILVEIEQIKTGDAPC